MGSARGCATPLAISDGPIARNTSVFGSEPLMMKPPMRTFSSVPTLTLVDRLVKWAAGICGVAVGPGMGVAVGVETGVAVAVAVGVGLSDAVGVALMAGSGVP